MTFKEIVKLLMPGVLKKKVHAFNSRRFNKKSEREIKWDNFINDQKTVKIKHDLTDTVHINLYKNYYLSSFIYNNEFEDETLQFIYSVLQKDGCFVDIGANIGFFSLNASAIVGDKGIVYAFEPANNTFNKLKENIESNKMKNISMHKLALSDAEGVKEFHISTDGYDAFNSFVMPVHGKDYILEKTDIARLDGFYNDLKQYTNLVIKIDVEGWEYHVVNGAQKVLLALNPILIIEFNDENTSVSEFRCTHLFKLLESLNYSMYNLVEGKLIPKQNEDYFTYQNIIAKKVINYEKGN